jgi:K+-sensing histidine kinase KdpD
VIYTGSSSSNVCSAYRMSALLRCPNNLLDALIEERKRAKNDKSSNNIAVKCREWMVTNNIGMYAFVCVCVCVCHIYMCVMYMYHLCVMCMSYVSHVCVSYLFVSYVCAYVCHVYTTVSIINLCNVTNILWCSSSFSLHHNSISIPHVPI